MINKKQEELLKKFPIEENMKMKQQTLIHIASKNLLMLQNKWEYNNINGETYVFLTEEINKYKEEDLIKIIEPYILKKNTIINKYTLKKIKEYTFFYYTIK